MELPDKTPKEKQKEKPKETSPFMQATLGNKTFFKPTTLEAINELKTEPIQLKTYGVYFFKEPTYIRYTNEINTQINVPDVIKNNVYKELKIFEIKDFFKNPPYVKYTNEIGTQI